MDAAHVASSAHLNATHSGRDKHPDGELSIALVRGLRKYDHREHSRPRTEKTENGRPEFVNLKGAIAIQLEELEEEDTQACFGMSQTGSDCNLKCFEC